jgi:hypothetical protein
LVQKNEGFGLKTSSAHSPHNLGPFGCKQKKLKEIRPNPQQEEDAHGMSPSQQNDRSNL